MTHDWWPKDCAIGVHLVPLHFLKMMTVENKALTSQMLFTSLTATFVH